jgi:hypothetical protein
MIVRFLILSLRASHANTAVKIGLVVTRTTELATVVRRRDSIQKRKWRERNRPASIHRPICLGVISARPRVFKKKGNKISDARESLYAAITAVGTVQSLMSIAAKDTTTIADAMMAMALLSGLKI